MHKWRSECGARCLLQIGAASERTKPTWPWCCICTRPSTSCLRSWKWGSKQRWSRLWNMRLRAILRSHSRYAPGCRLACGSVLFPCHVCEEHACMSDMY